MKKPKTLKEILKHLEGCIEFNGSGREWLRGKRKK